MKSALLSVIVLSVLLAGATEAADPKPAPSPATQAADRGGWPETRAGELARGWVTSFSTGESAMKEFLARNLAPKSLESKSMPQRIVRYRELREKYGRLELISVVESSPEKLTVKLMAEDATRHEFVFTAQTEAPYKLVSVGIKEPGHFGFGGFGH
jgi:hypothetical protein